MRVAFINGSPKVKTSASKVLLQALTAYFPEKAQVVELEFHSATIPKEAMETLHNADAWVFAYPLYVDGIPGHLLSCLTQLEKVSVQNQKISVYGIVNCGFYEGAQAEFALQVLENFCNKAGVTWGGGIGVGGGGAVEMLPTIEQGKGPRAPIDAALQKFAEAVIGQTSAPNNYVSIGFPRCLYRFAAQNGWRRNIKKNGGKTKDLGFRPE